VQRAKNGDRLSDLIELGRGDIHLWYVRTEDAKRKEWLTLYHDLMPGDERERHQRFVFQKDRDQFLIARALLRKTLSRYSTVQPGDWRFQVNEFGKPEIDVTQNPSQLRFNVSHCDGLILCGVTAECQIGVDCENIDRSVEIERLAPRVFAAKEREYLYSVPESLRTETFFRFWTLKEAYIKARGIGMSLSLREFSFDISATQLISVSFSPRIEDRPQNWQFEQPTVPGPFVIALAVDMPVDEKSNIELWEA